MNTVIRKIGNSEGVIIPRDILDRLNIHAGDTVTLIEDSDGLRLKRAEMSPEEFEQKMKIARERMKKYEVAYRALAR